MIGCGFVVLQGGLEQLFMLFFWVCGMDRYGTASELTILTRACAIRFTCMCRLNDLVGLVLNVLCCIMMQKLFFNSTDFSIVGRLLGRRWWRGRPHCYVVEFGLLRLSLVIATCVTRYLSGCSSLLLPASTALLHTRLAS